MTRRRAWIGLLLLAGATALLGQQAARLPTAYDVEQFFPSGDPEVEQYHRFREAFGLRDTSVLLLLTGQEVFSAGAVRTVTALTDALARLDGVEAVTSLTNAVEVRAGGDGEVLVGQPLGDEYPGPAALPTIRARLLADPLFAGRLVARDGRTTCVLLRLAPDHTSPAAASRMEEAIHEAVRGAGGAGGFEVMLGGPPLVRARYTRLIQQDMGTYLPLVLGGFALLLLIIFRSVQGVVLPLACVGLAVVWALGGYHLSGGALSTLTSLVPVLLLVIGLSDAVHFLARHQRLCRAPPPEGTPLALTLRQVGGACLLTTLTTAAGFLALALSDMAAVRTFGLLTAAGVVAALAATVAFLPAALSLLPAPRQRPPRRKARLTARALDGLAGLCTHRPWQVLAGVAAVALLAGVGVSRVSREIRLYGNLPDGHPLLAAERFADKNLGGALTVEVMLDGGEEGGAASPAALGELVRLEGWLRGRPEVTAVRSALDPLRATHRVVAGPNQALPLRADVIGQYLLLLTMGDGDPTEPYLDFTRRRARLSAQLPDLPQSRALALLDGLRARAAEAPAGITVRVTGSTALLHKVYRDVVDGMAYSFALAFGVIFVIISLLLRSPGLGLLSMLPNLVPLLMTLGFMGWAGIPLAPTTSLVFAVAFGIAVDDTIHFLAHFRRLRRAGAGVDRAVRETMAESGRPIIWTSLILAGGFSVLLASSFLGNRYFGLILAVTMLAALLADLLLLPALLVLWGRIRR